MIGVLGVSWLSLYKDLSSHMLCFGLSTNNVTNMSVLFSPNQLHAQSLPAIFNWKGQNINSRPAAPVLSKTLNEQRLHRHASQNPGHYLEHLPNVSAIFSFYTND